MYLIYFVLTVIVVSIVVLYKRTKAIPSQEVITEIHSLIDDIVAQSNLLETNISFLQNNVDMLKIEVEHLKDRNTELALQIREIGETVKEALSK